MADWIHCNMCFIQPRDGDGNFLLTSCGHVFCSTCENRENGGECKICKTSCTIIKLRGDVLPNVKEYFEEPLAIAEKLLKVIRFQKAHRMSLFKSHSRNGEKYQKAKVHIQKLETQMYKMESHIKKLEKKVEYYEKHRSPAAPIEPFNFTPCLNDTGESQSHFFNSTQSKKSSIDTPRFQKPESNAAFTHYRYETEFTPASQSAVTENTPHSTGGYYSRYQRNGTTNSTPRPQAKYPLRTPPYSALNNLKITGSRK